MERESGEVKEILEKEHALLIRVVLLEGSWNVRRACDLDLLDEDALAPSTNLSFFVPA